MKWFALVVTLMLGGMLAYGLFSRDAPAGTPLAVAEAFADAALDSDDARIRSLCAAAVASQALDVAERVRLAPPPFGAFSFSAVTVTPPRRAYAATFSGRLLQIVLEPVGERWVIVQIDMTA